MGKNWLLYLGSLAGALVFHTFYFGWYSWFILILTLVLPLFSFVVSILAMIRVKLRLQCPAAVLRGERAAVTMEARGSFLPMPRLRFLLTETHVLTGTVLKWKQRSPGEGSWAMPLDTDHCGLIVCAAQRVKVFDYLGLFALPVKPPRPVELQVWPVAAPPARLPNLSQFLARRRQPKPGGGFSEEHELRDYRPGDSMRDIHWKLSVKTDRMVVREAQEPIRGLTLLTFDLAGTPAQVDSVLDQLSWLSQWLLDHDVAHRLLWVDPTDCKLRQASVEQAEDLESLVAQLLRCALGTDTPSMAARRFPNASWRYHLEPEQEAAP